MIRFKASKVCVDCGKAVSENQLGSLSDFCGKMWRKYNRLSDEPCGLYAHAKIKTSDGELKSLPRIKGRT